MACGIIGNVPDRAASLAGFGAIGVSLVSCPVGQVGHGSYVEQCCAWLDASPRYASAAAAIGFMSVVEDAVRSGCHRPVFRPDAESGSRYLKVRVATP